MVYYRALYPFESRSHDEISIQPGDIVMVRAAGQCLLSVAAPPFCGRDSGELVGA